jgi:hypothetical protein
MLLLTYFRRVYDGSYELVLCTRAQQLKLPASNSGICLLFGSPVVLCTSPAEDVDYNLSTAQAPSCQMSVPYPQLDSLAYLLSITFEFLSD